jgi:allophanate hydrolase
MTLPTSLRIDELHSTYAETDTTPVEVMRAVHDRARADETNAWITLRERSALEERVHAVAGMDRAEAPLYGVPFAVKDNVDVAGLPTTAACPAYEYTAEASATVVERLQAAGAVLVGKTNMDQFATGLVGTRSPYGDCHNPHDPAYISGGSSSGSGAAVADGQVSFALGTDTAGSGRVPAALTGIVGLKPTRGTVSTAGVVPACKTLDCVATFAPSVPDAVRVTRVMAGPDPADPTMRTDGLADPTVFDPPAVEAGTVGVVPAAAREFFGDDAAAAAYEDALSTLADLGWEVEPVAFEPFRETAELLYEGPWVAERLTVVEELLADDPEALLPVIREIIERGADYDATDVFEAQYDLAALRQRAREALADVDLLVTPTTGTVYTREAVAEAPVETNATLGYYTNYVNLLDMAALAVPTGLQDDGIPFGVTLTAEAGTDGLLAAVGHDLHRAAGLSLGATDETTAALEPLERAATERTAPPDAE